MRQTFEKDGKIRSFEVVDGRAMATLQIGGKWVANPTLEAFLADGWREYIAPEPEVIEDNFVGEGIEQPIKDEVVEPPKKTYEQRVVELIRLHYSVDDELAILRQRDTKTEEFEEYNSYCENCKTIARVEFGLNVEKEVTAVEEPTEDIVKPIEE